MPAILLSGAIANKPLSGGEAWVRMSWLRGLRRLGFDVCLVEQVESSTCVDAEGRPAPFEDSVNRRTFESVVEALAPDAPTALICDGGRATVGLGLAEVVDRAADCELLVNISGHLDLDPGFTQVWAAEGRDSGLAGHDVHFTVGQNIGRPGCGIPSNGIEWLPLPPPVTLEDWPRLPAKRADRFTTVATWRSPLGTLTHGGIEFQGKHHQWRRMIDLPRRSPFGYEIALQIHPDDADDRTALQDHGWHLVDPRSVAGDPISFREYVQGSSAEFSVAHPVYVEMASGWISDRTVRYLASGRPALVQDTGISSDYGGGEGLVTFRTIEEAVAGAERIAGDHQGHSAAARSLAETHFDSDRVLSRFLDQAGVS